MGFKKIRSVCCLLLLFGSVNLSAAQEQPFTATGNASWFGKWHHGKTTASSEPFDMYAMTAAHRTLPFGIVLKVTCDITKREILVRINDRGPFRRNRIIDLSYAAAETLGMRQLGVAKVHLEAVTDEDGALLDPSQSFFVRLEKDEQKLQPAEAAAQLAGFIQMGYYEAMELLQIVGDDVVLGPFADFDRAQAALQRVVSIFPKTVIVMENPDRAKPVAFTHALFRPPYR